MRTEKTYDEAYFRKWYRDPKKRLVRRAGVARKAAMAVGVAEHLLGRRVASVLDIGCGEGAWFPLLRELRPKLRYLGLDTSDYAVRRFGRSRNVRPGSWGQVAELRFDEPFDLVVCSDALHYVPTREVVRGLESLSELIGGVAYFDFLTADDDLETGIEGDLVGFKMRRAAWYRRKLRGADLVECGLGFWVTPARAPQLTALERVPGRNSHR
ncbi:MAG: class I SAM-dependent methyltransferase [Thermoanaerobaculia bacterium]|nr:class I SAM-dependent methyltransferase [Thermoanaerobaculia bacterium]